MNSEPISILIVEDQELIRLGLRLSFQRQEGFVVVGEAADGLSAIKKAIELRPQLAIVDIGLPGLNGIEAGRRIKASLPATKVLILTLKDDDDSILDALHAGADGYCLKDISQEDLSEAISRIVDGHFWIQPRLGRRLGAAFVKQSAGAVEGETLTSRKREILEILTRKLSVAEIGQLLSFTEKEMEEQFAPSQSEAGSADAKPQGKQSSGPRLFVGTVFAGRYRIDKFIGQGGMGRVYQATHLMMDRKVALKLLHPQFIDDRKLVKKFHQESKSASLLNHPNIVTIFDFGVSDDDIPYLVMDFIEGCGLDVILRESGRLSLTEFYEIFSAVLAGLNEAHENGIVHCDLKPSNIVVERTARGSRVKIVDFGLARIQPVGKGLQFRSTDAFEIVGSPLYMSPEQCKGEALDQRTDIYSLGCVMYEALCGQPAFNGSTPMVVFMKQVEEMPPPITREMLGYEPPQALVDMIFTALRKAPSERTMTALEMRQVLAALSGEKFGKTTL
ncbi:MAG: protein kinase [Candidatus Obscuribacter sp.]|nr:protein kinase [Candidatus Obscuribacter sp.]